jgi:hypothetical protein
MPKIGVARTCTQAVAYSAQGKSGMRIQFMPLARRRCMVVMKLSPVMIDENPISEGAQHGHAVTLVPVLTL